MSTPIDPSRSEPVSVVEIFRREQSRTLGLPDSATVADICDRQLDLFRIHMAKDRGLPDHATLQEIFAYDDDFAAGKHDGAALRRTWAKRLGKPEETPWDVLMPIIKQNEARLLAGC